MAESNEIGSNDDFGARITGESRSVETHGSGAGAVTSHNAIRRWDQLGAGVRQAVRGLPGRDSEFMRRSWQESYGDYNGPSGTWWNSLPIANQMLLGFLGLMFVLVVVRIGGVPVRDWVTGAVYPYTAEGKRATCLDNLKAIHAAVSLYAEDYDGRFPPLEAVGGDGGRRTWVGALSPRVPVGIFQCPSAPGVPAASVMTWGSYVMAPVLGGQSVESVDDVSATLFFAEGGAKHDVSLLPPLPSWGHNIADTKNGESIDPAELNLGFRHRGRANMLFADGHVDSREPGNWAALPATWGGSAAMRLALQRIERRSSESRAFIKRLDTGDSGSTAGFLKAQQGNLATTTNDLIELWKVNAGSSEKVEKIGWNLARAKEAAGEGKVRQEFEKVMTERADVEFKAAMAAGTQPRSTGNRLQIPTPLNWTMEVKQDRRYHHTYFRSGLRDLFILCEVGTRDRYTEPGPVDWDGTENGTRRRYGHGYRRVRRVPAQLLGMPASIWEFEIEKPGSPRLRKLYIGASGSWESYVVTCTAPAKEFNNWKPIFENALAGLRFG